MLIGRLSSFAVGRGMEGWHKSNFRPGLMTIMHTSYDNNEICSDQKGGGQALLLENWACKNESEGFNGWHGIEIGGRGTFCLCLTDDGD